MLQGVVLALVLVLSSLALAPVQSRKDILDIDMLQHPMSPTYYRWIVPTRPTGWFPSGGILFPLSPREWVDCHDRVVLGGGGGFPPLFVVCLARPVVVEVIVEVVVWNGDDATMIFDHGESW